MTTTTIMPGVYRHYKGSLYEVYDIARHSEDETLLVVYRPCYGDKALWVRPLEMFGEKVEKDGVQIPRFDYIRPLPDTDKNET